MKSSDYYKWLSLEENYSIVKWAKILKISTSGYYSWRNSNEDRYSRYLQRVESVKDVFTEGKGCYGAEHICGILRKNGGKASFKIVRDIMNEQGLKCCHNRRRQKTLTDSRKAGGNNYPNLTTGLEITRPFQVLSSDISYIRTAEGFDYLCQVRDVYTNITLSHTQSNSLKSELVENTLRALQSRWHLPKGTIFHSDRGKQYTSKLVSGLLEKYGFLQSFSRVGKPGDNAWSESFFSILKKEIIHWRFYPTRDSAREAVFNYIEVFYNRVRKQKRLGYLSPIQFLESRKISGEKIAA
jgi:putative transposase